MREVSVRAAVAFYERLVRFYSSRPRDVCLEVWHEPVRGRDRVGSCDGVQRTGARLGETPKHQGEARPRLSTCASHAGPVGRAR